MAPDEISEIHSQLTLRIWGSFNFLHGISREWGAVLLHPDFDREPSLRNKVFAIWACALAENAAESENTFNPLKRQAGRVDSRIASHYLDLISVMHDEIADALSPLSFKDMVAVHELRNRFVHGDLYGGKLAVRFSDGGHIRTNRITSEDAHKIYTNVWAEKGWDSHLLECRAKIMSKRSLFWNLHSLMMPTDVVECIMHDLRQWDNSILPAVSVEFIDGSYESTQKKLGKELRTFWFNREATASDSGQGLDPVIELMNLP